MPNFFSREIIGGCQGGNWGFLTHKICVRFKTKFWGDFWVEKNWGVLQHKFCRRFRTKFLGYFWGRKIGNFTAQNLWEIQNQHLWETHYRNLQSQQKSFSRFTHYKSYIRFTQKELSFSMESTNFYSRRVDSVVVFEVKEWQ